MKRVLLLSVLTLIVGMSEPSAAGAKSELTPHQRLSRLWQQVGPEYGGGPLPVFVFWKVPLPVEGVTTYPGGLSHPGGDRPVSFISRRITRWFVDRQCRDRRSGRYVVLWEIGRQVQGDRDDTWLAYKTNTVSRRLNRKAPRSCRERKS